MKKIMIVFVFLLLILSLTSCDDSKHFEVVAMPRDIEYAMFTGHSYVEGGKVYLYEEMLKKEIIKDRIVFLSTVDITESVYAQDKAFVIGYMGSNLFSKSYDFVFAYFDRITKEIEIISYFNPKDREICYKKIGDYIVLQYDNDIKVYDPNSMCFIREISLEEKWIPFTGYTSFGYMMENGFVLYDEYLNEFVHHADININEYGPYSKTFYYKKTYIRYFDISDNSLYYDCLNQMFVSEEEFNSVDENLITENPDSYFTINDEKDTLTCFLNGIEQTFTMEEFRGKKDIIAKVEELYDTNVYFQTVYFQNEEVYICVGNYDSFFFVSAPGRTLPLIFKVDLEDRNIYYIGAVGTIGASGFLKIIKL